MWKWPRRRSWPKRCLDQAEQNHIRTSLEDLLSLLQIQKERSETQSRRIDAQLREIHQRLDRIEGIR